MPELVVKTKPGEVGSAVVEFALLALPLCMMAIAFTNYSLNVYFDTLLRSGASAAVRFASLADTTLEQTQVELEKFCSGRFRQIQPRCQVKYDLGERQVAQVQIAYQPLSLLIFTPPEVMIRATSGLETTK